MAFSVSTLLLKPGIDRGSGDRLVEEAKPAPVTARRRIENMCFRLLQYFSTNRVDSRGLRWIPVDSTAADKRLTSNVLDHKLRVVSQLPKHARTGSCPSATWPSTCRVPRHRAGALYSAARPSAPGNNGRASRANSIRSPHSIELGWCKT